MEQLITPIDRNTISPDRVQWLFDRACGEAYAWDDYSKGRPEVFLLYLSAPNSAHFMVEDAGLVSLCNICQGLNANIHFLRWDKKYPIQQAMLVGEQVLTFGFEIHNLHRITASIPSYNREASRLAMLLGFKFEGSIRQAWLHDKAYHNLDIYGLLRQEFKPRTGTVQ